jgi:hypothetical protein
MSTQKNRLKAVLEGKNADTKRLKAELKALGIPPTTLWKYVNQPETDIKGSHIGIIMRVTGCTYEELFNGEPLQVIEDDFNLKA